jgi:hypothetical protein
MGPLQEGPRFVQADVSKVAPPQDMRVGFPVGGFEDIDIELEVEVNVEPV